MKKEVKIALVGFMSMYIFVGCSNSNPTPVITSNPNKAPLKIEQLTKLKPCSNFISVLGSPNKINGNIFYYNVSDNQLKNDVVIEIYKYENSFSLNTKIENLPYKENDILRDKYYYYLDKIDEAKCSIEGEYLCYKMPTSNSRFAIESAERKTKECNDMDLKRKETIQKYEDRMIDLKEELIKTRKVLPDWYKYDI
ncbi:hypothetical protein [Aliarcobacter butzleri]|uniref:hypothetical protein n=1 Tax=Aliarcobacter butzleri TaxID=28197 RepID=UPI000F479BEB|nr:hypothetical protein [Aliarcobacter butzleri]MDK2050934.1 hypothetical protein [Aliarcobacter butzleri]